MTALPWGGRGQASTSCTTRIDAEGSGGRVDGEGLAEGRHKITTHAIRNQILLACAVHGHAAVLNVFWQQVCDGRHPESYFVLSWPTPGVSGTNM